MNRSHGSALPIEELVAEAFFTSTRPPNSSAALQPSKRPAGLGIIIVFPGYSHGLIVQCPVYARSDADGVANCALSLPERYGLSRAVIHASVDIRSRIKAVDSNPLLTNARTDFERLGDEVGKRVVLAPRFSKKTLSKEHARIIARATEAAVVACEQALVLQACDPNRANSVGGINTILGWHEDDVDLADLGLK